MILFLVYIILLCKSPHGYDHWKCVHFFDWQISLSVMTFSPISGVTNGLFSMSKTPPCMDVYSLSFISSLVDWYLGYFYFSVIMNFASTFLLLWKISRLRKCIEKKWIFFGLLVPEDWSPGCQNKQQAAGRRQLEQQLRAHTPNDKQDSERVKWLLRTARSPPVICFLQQSHTS